MLRSDVRGQVYFTEKYCFSVGMFGCVGVVGQKRTHAHCAVVEIHGGRGKEEEGKRGKGIVCSRV